MKRWFNLLVVASFYLATQLSVIAQDFKQDILKMHEAYDCLDYLSMNVEINYYESGLNNGVSSTEKAIVKIGNKRSYSFYDNLERLVNEKYSILVDHESKEIIFYEHNQRLDNHTQNETLPLLEAYGDSLINSIGKSSFVGFEDGSIVYEVVDEDAQLYKTKMYIGKEHHLITRATMFYQDDTDEGLVIDVHYSEIDLDPAFDTNCFSERRFFTKKGSDYMPVESLKDYTLINTDKL